MRTPDGKNSFTADDATKASWITVTSAQGVVPTLSVDSAKVSAWVQSQSEEVAEEPVNGERNVNSSGAVVGVKVEAVNGTKVTNVDALTTAIVRALGSGTPYSGTFETETIEATWKNKTSNGYLAAYLCGIILGNSNINNKKALVNFFDGITGLMQMLLFFILGLLSNPSMLPH